jgi:hypothetical protein
LVHAGRLREFDGVKDNTSLFQLELFAAIEALKVLKCRCAVTIFTRSAHLAGIYAKKRPRAHPELWERFEELCRHHDTKVRFGPDPKWVSQANRNLLTQCSARARRRLKDACRLSNTLPPSWGSTASAEGSR